MRVDWIPVTHETDEESGEDRLTCQLPKGQKYEDPGAKIRIRHLFGGNKP